ncbi:hypothetical protein K1T73_05705 [Roseovarius sp. SCSIO 43702]|uniref:hypothetical protein n=1 Tax=Roseovarius sp. SCSIO 43702 TaxID=2823043 RepID=UPI001C73890B|nr:hypothetical protein [Roseovarius sp. SCSIO 43702]QYX57882.1 hypothetical protein K1T73_05705 [Roseovarius sp. SCSIO 43702]
MSLARQVLSAICLVPLFAAPLAADGVPAPEQHRAIVDCHARLGKAGWPKIKAVYVATPWGGPTVMRALPTRRVSAAEAAWINSCADRLLGRATVPVRLVVKRTGPCPPHAPTLYRGTTYCIGN